MEEIRAFVGHSFAQEDGEVVACFLEYFTRLSKLHPTFSWDHAEDAEPKGIAEKVMSLIENKNVFIGICTKKEYVIQPTSLTRPRVFNRRQLLIQKDQFYWKTSDWIIQEIGLAMGRNLYIILLVESDVQLPDGLQSDLEHIIFDRTAPEKSFGKILEMLKALSPKSHSTTVVIATSTQSGPAEEQNSPELPKDDGWKTPKPEWTRREYEITFWVMTVESDQETAAAINKAYLATEVASQDDNKSTWEAFCEYTRLRWGKGGSFANLKALADKHPDNCGVLDYLAKGFEIYEDYAESARVYEDAAMKTQDEMEQLRFLANAAEALAQAGQKKL